MDAAAFVDKWRMSRRTERSASQEHFLDLCELLHHPKPGAVDPKGLSFTTERRERAIIRCFAPCLIFHSGRQFLYTSGDSRSNYPANGPRVGAATL